MSENPISGYRYANADLGHAHDYLLPCVLRVLNGLAIAGGGGGGGGGAGGGGGGGGGGEGTPPVRVGLR